MAEQDRRVTRRIGPLDIEWPRSIGYYGGIGLAVAAGMFGAPVALSIAAIPFLKVLNPPTASWPPTSSRRCLVAPPNRSAAPARRPSSSRRPTRRAGASGD